jgi:hypothetical protein
MNTGEIDIETVTPVSDETIAGIRKGLALLYEGGDVVELRVPRDLNRKWDANISGFFDDLQKLAEAIHEVNTRYKRTVYTTLNPLKRGWQYVNNRWYRGGNKLKKDLGDARRPLTPCMKEGWKDGEQYFTLRMSNDDDVLKRRWILIDIDAGQPAGMNSSDAEKQDALEMAREVIHYLEGRGFPTPALTNSGNGYHVYVRIDFENSPEMKVLVRRFLKALGQRFTGKYGTALVDEAMFNPARITKATGSFVHKGANTPKRPQRRSGVISAGSRVPATLEQVKGIADEYVPTKGETFESWTGDDMDVVVDDEKLRNQVTILKRYLERNGIKYGAVTFEDRGIMLPCVCPNSAEHTTATGGTLAMVNPSGSFGFCCQHAHCSELRSWKCFREFVDARFRRTHPNEPAFQWSLGTVTVADIQLVEPKPATKKSRIKTARAKANDERLAEAEARLGSKPDSVIVINEGTDALAEWLLDKLCQPSCFVKEANARAAELGISKRLLRRTYPAAGVIVSHADRAGARLVKASSMAEANAIVLATAGAK